MKYSIVAIIFLSTLAFGDSSVQSVAILGKCVTVQLPARWEKQSRNSNGDREAIGFMIPFKGSEDTPESANAALFATRVAPSETAKSFGDRILARMIDPKSGNVIVSDTPDGTNWRTVLWHGQQGSTAYIIMDRFGVLNGIGVQLRVAYPLLKSGDATEVDQTNNEFNAAIKTLAVSCPQ